MTDNHISIDLLLWFLDRLHKSKSSDNRSMRQRLRITHKDWSVMSQSIQYEKTLEEYKRIVRILTTGKMRTVWYLKKRNYRGYMEARKIQRKKSLQKQKGLV